MDSRDRSIITQVAFKEASAWTIHNQVDLTTDEGKSVFETVFSHLLDSLLIAVETVNSVANEQAETIKGQFPGSTWESGEQAQGGTTLVVRGTQHGPLPTWLFEQAAAKGVTEVIDQRDQVGNSNKPHFKSATGGYNAPAFWPPKTGPRR